MGINLHLNIVLCTFLVTLRVSLFACVGLMPYNLVCVQTGAVLSDLSSLDDVLSKGVVLKLLLIASIALLPSAIIHRYGNKHPFTRSKHKDN